MSEICTHTDQIDALTMRREIVIDGVAREVSCVHVSGLGDVVQDPPAGHLPAETLFQINGGEIYTAGQEIGFLTKKGERRLVTVWGRARGISARLLVNAHARVEKTEGEFEIVDTTTRGFTIGADTMRHAIEKQNAIVARSRTAVDAALAPAVDEVSPMPSADTPVVDGGPMVMPTVVPESVPPSPEKITETGVFGVLLDRGMGEWHIHLARGTEQKTFAVSRGDMLEVSREVERGDGTVGTYVLHVRVGAASKDGVLLATTVSLRDAEGIDFETTIPPQFAHPSIGLAELWQGVERVAPPAKPRTTTRQGIADLLGALQSGWRRLRGEVSASPADIPAGIHHFGGEFGQPPAAE